MMLILGMDPGSLAFGVGIVERRAGQILHVHSEVIRPSGGDFTARMGDLWKLLGALLERFPVQEAAMEEGFLGKNVRSQNVLAMVRGVAMAALIARGVAISFYAPRLVKQAITGYGNAGKPQVQRMVQLLLKVPGTSSLDESDALAVACCHALRPS